MLLYSLAQRSRCRRVTFTIPFVPHRDQSGCARGIVEGWRIYYHRSEDMKDLPHDRPITTRSWRNPIAPVSSLEHPLIDERPIIGSEKDPPIDQVIPKAERKLTRLLSRIDCFSTDRTVDFHVGSSFESRKQTTTLRRGKTHRAKNRRANCRLLGLDHGTVRRNRSTENDRRWSGEEYISDRRWILYLLRASEVRSRKIKATLKPNRASAPFFHLYLSLSLECRSHFFKYLSNCPVNRARTPAITYENYVGKLLGGQMEESKNDTTKQRAGEKDKRTRVIAWLMRALSALRAGIIA